MPSAGNRVVAEDKVTFLGNVSKKAEMYHGRVPYLRRLPFSALAIIIVIAMVNAAAWVAVGIVLHFHPALISTAILSYTLGLRHALDADHISAIDLMTRRLIAAGQRPVTVGMFFSLGHSTIVIVTSIVVAATASAVSDKFDRFSHVGGIIGTSVSAAFLILLGIMNAYILYRMIKQLNALIATHPSDEVEEDFKIQGAGCLFNVFKGMFRMIDRPWKMYPLGLLFGLGFDTSSEIALLGISSIQAARGASLWLILVFPLLFTAGMCLLDTADGALMLALYTSANNNENENDRIATLYYGVALTGLTVAVALGVGTLQLLALALAVGVGNPEGRFWEGVARAGDAGEIVGGAVCASFVVCGVMAVVLYAPWRRWVDARRERVVPRWRGESGRDGRDGDGDGDGETALVGAGAGAGAAERPRGGGRRSTPYGTVEILDDEENRHQVMGRDEGNGKGGGHQVSAREVGERA
ncbi:high-affinity nickel-transporter [Diplodia corticola]|uniref:Nickel/cobalt efflux system n=1 Tax=Diplodia corticola TaxID=236234 RepID=A0A1J9S2U8_9PEZI|nr:high-affinity nickel-transporter [Diplodia corticola]OJD34879.1 high-affinity nickel-transporter [Diplodia corticola]